jgi:hypothetical protein
MHPNKGPGTIAPTGTDPQGPSPIDYNLEIDAEFPQDMVTEMQGNATKKARKTVIGRTLGGENNIQSIARMPEAPPLDVLHFNHTLNLRLLPDSLRERGRSRCNKKTRNRRLERAQPLFLKVLTRFRC